MKLHRDTDLHHPEDPFHENASDKPNLKDHIQQVGNVYRGDDQRPAQYSVSINNFLTKGIVIVGILLVVVFIIAFLL